LFAPNAPPPSPTSALLHIQIHHFPLQHPHRAPSSDGAHSFSFPPSLLSCSGPCCPRELATPKTSRALLPLLSIVFIKRTLMDQHAARPSAPCRCLSRLRTQNDVPHHSSFVVSFHDVVCCSCLRSKKQTRAPTKT
jgi:hypothetical protein